MINRREFIKRISLSSIAAAVAVKLPFRNKVMPLEKQFSLIKHNPFTCSSASYPVKDVAFTLRELPYHPRKNDGE